MQKNQRRRGSALVELAVVTPLMIVLLFGAIQFGYFYYVYNLLDKSVRDGARYAATRTYATDDAGSNALYVTAIQNTVCYGSPASTSASPMTTVPNLNCNNVMVVPDKTAARPDRIKVYVSSYTFKGALGTLTITNKPYVEVPFLGRYVSE